MPYLSLLFYLNLQSWAHGTEKESPKRNKVAERGRHGVMVFNLQQGRKEILHDVAASLRGARGMSWVTQQS